MLLIAPNGSEINANDEAVPKLIAQGFALAADEKPEPKPKRTTRKKSTTKE